MRVAVFTSNQPRHLAFIEKLATIADDVYAVVETTTAFPGQVDDFYRKSPAMQLYFSRVLEAEVSLFGVHRPPPQNVRVLPVKMGDLSLLAEEHLVSVMSSDHYLVFGSSFIRGWLADTLVDRRAINVHMGLSPYYRGTACNFWALYDERPAFVGATVHLLSRGLDNGPILFHVRPSFRGQDPFVFTMQAVEDVQIEIGRRMAQGDLTSLSPIDQDKSLELRYSRNRDFTDGVAAEFLERAISSEDLRVSLDSSSSPELRA